MSYEKFTAAVNINYLASATGEENNDAFTTSVMRFYTQSGRQLIYNMPKGTYDDIIIVLKTLNYHFIQMHQATSQSLDQSGKQLWYEEDFNKGLRLGKPKTGREFDAYSAWHGDKTTDEEIAQEFYDRLLNDDSISLGHNIIKSITLTTQDKRELTKRYDALPVANTDEELNRELRSGSRPQPWITEKKERDRAFFKKRMLPLNKH